VERKTLTQSVSQSSMVFSALSLYHHIVLRLLNLLS